MPGLGARGSRAREGGSGVRAPARPLQAPGSGRERRLGLAALSIPVLCFGSKGKLLSLGPSASRRKLPSSQSRCLGLALVRGFMALHLYPPRTAAKCAVKGVSSPPRSEGSNPSARGSARGRKPLLKVCLQAANTASWCPLRVLPESVRTPGPVGWRPRPRSGPAHSLVA